jgi:hypothetical protein
MRSEHVMLHHERSCRWESCVARSSDVIDVARVLAVAACLALAVPATSLGSFPGRSGVIAYQAGGEVCAPQGAEIACFGGIWALDPFTGNERQLTFGKDTWPSFSPNGNLLAFERYTPRSYTIYLARADGSDTRPLLSGREPAFSPNGRDLVFRGSNGIYIADIARPERTRRITRHSGDASPVWGSNGAIVFQRTTPPRPQSRALPVRSSLEVIDLATLRVHTALTINEYVTMLPDWSPSAQFVVINLCLRPRSRRRLEAADAHPRLRFACGPAVWSPHGHRVIEAAGLLSHSPLDSLCPELLNFGRVAWQPIVAGTLPVATEKCGTRPPPEALSGYGAEPRGGVSASKEEYFGARRTEVCVYSHRRHRKICVKI